MSSKKVDMPKQKKPKIGKIYKVWTDRIPTLYNTMLIQHISENIAFYTSNGRSIGKWDYVKYPEFLDYELSSLEEELL
jgi:hypothetical protein